ncbi:hypothetical protein D9M71_813860 [compost metagenome]
MALISALLAASARLALKRSSLIRRRRSLTDRLSSRPLKLAMPSRMNSSHCVGVRVRPRRAGSTTRQPMLKASIDKANSRAGA